MEYSTIVQIIVKDERGDVTFDKLWDDDLLSLNRRKNSINSQSTFCTQSAVCILYPVCSMHSAFCTDRIDFNVFVRASLKSGPKYWSSKKKKSETILAAMIDVWTVCWRAPEDKHNDRAMITLYQLQTNVIWLPLMLFRVVTASVEMNPLRVP